MIDSLNVKSDSLNYIYSVKDSSNIKVNCNRAIFLKKEDKSHKIFEKISDDTAFTVWVTISIFILGVIIDRIVKAIDKWNEKRKLKQFYLFNINLMSEKLFPNINKLYRSFYLNHDIDTGIPMSPPKVLSQDVERLNRIEFDKLYSAFQNKVKLAKVMASVDFISKAIHEVDSYHIHVYSVSQEMRINFQTILGKYTEMLAEYLKYEQSHNPAYKTDSTYLLLNNSLLKFHREIAGKRALKKLYKEIIRPIQSELVEKTRKFEDHEVGIVIAKLGRDLSYRYNEIKIISLEIRLQYRYVYLQINKSIENLQVEKAEL